MKFTEEQLQGLYESVRSRMSDYRFNHTSEVEKMAVRLGELYAPDKTDVLRAAALLHDVTKELDTDAHAELLKREGVEISELDRLLQKTLHARSAVVLIKEEYPEFADEEVLDAVRYHTTGRKGMTACERIIYLADYIDLSRKFEDCVYLRNYFWGEHPENMSQNRREIHLLRTMLLSFDLTLGGLVKEESPISIETAEARNDTICLLNALQKDDGCRNAL